MHGSTWVRAPSSTSDVKNVVFDLKPEPLEAEVALHEHAALHAVAAGVAG
jgi:hypothetical protein